MECGFAGNADIFGVGIRIGYYTQALAVWFASYFHCREARNLRSVNNLFLIALAIVGLIFVYDARRNYAVEAFLLLYIGITTAVISIPDSSRFTSRYMQVSNERMLANTIISFMGPSFYVWFCWKGLDIMRPTPCSNIETAQSKQTEGTYGTLIVPVNMYGWFWTVGRIFSLLALAESVLVIGSAYPLKLLHSVLTKSTRTCFIAAAVSSLTNDTTLSPARVPDGSQSRRILVDFLSTSNPFAAEGSANFDHSSEGIPAIRDAEMPAVTFPMIYEAEKYLDSVFSISQEQGAMLGHKRMISFWKGYLRFYVPQHAFQHTPGLVPLRECFYTVFIWYGVSRVPVHLRWRIHLHLASMGRGPTLMWPRLMHRALQLSNDNKPPDWRLVAIASDVQLLQIPLKKSARAWAVVAAKNLFLILLFIAQVEITIIWNHISGLSQLTSLGQLIPFILGVGGLIKILWSKWRMVKKGVREDTSLPPPSKYEVAMVTYLEWKRVHESSLPSGSMGNEHKLTARDDATSTADNVQDTFVVPVDNDCRLKDCSPVAVSPNTGSNCRNPEADESRRDELK